MVVKGVRQYNQNHKSRMALIRPSFTSSGLQIDAPGMAPLLIPYSPLPEDIIEIEYLFRILNLCIVIIFYRVMNVKGRRYGENISNWFSTFLETPGLDLVYFDEDFEPQHVKNLEPEFPNEALDSDVTGYNDVSPFHLGSLESINDLNKRLTNPIKIYNFRPNIIVSGVETPYGEVRYSFKIRINILSI
jgi:hypothetical protein